MPDTSAVMQMILVFLTLILLTLAFISPQVFRGANSRYLFLASAGITIVSFFFLESTLSHYLLKFYHYAGWNGYFLYLTLLFILITPLISTLMRSLSKIQIKRIVTHTSSRKITPEPVTKEIIVKDTTTVVTKPILSKDPELPHEVVETKTDEIQIPEETQTPKLKKQAPQRKQTAGRKSTRTRKNSPTKKNTEPKKDTGGENAKD